MSNRLGTYRSHTIRRGDINNVLEVLFVAPPPKGDVIRGLDAYYRAEFINFDAPEQVLRAIEKTSSEQLVQAIEKVFDADDSSKVTFVVNGVIAEFYLNTINYGYENIVVGE